ncbi:MAG: F0F1 ATP synthase subunit B [Marinicaulis sp.]|nr:F0F1 ATP synthase subunit B [Marinicaulis sp.]NNL90397.1 F0F1 ATP synthase subunit B [Marinicaulis sp.]
MFSLVSIAAAVADETHEAASKGLLADTSFWVLVAFVIVIGVFIRAGVHKSIASGLDKRGQRIADELDAARKMREEAQELLAQYQRRQREAENEAAAIIEQAKADAKRMAVEARDKINEQMTRREKAVEEKIKRAEAQAIAEVRNQTADLAVAAAERVIAERMDKTAQGAVIDKAISGLRNDIN